MGVGTFIHHIGTFLLLAATVLLVIVDISAPVVNHISLLRVSLPDSAPASSVSFGTFGYCWLDYNGSDRCSGSHIGYNPAGVIENSGIADFSSISENTPKALTRVMVLHPVATGLCFIAFLLCVGAGIVGSLLASLTSLLAFFVTLIALICDFVAFGIVKNKVNDSDADVHAYFDVAMWLLLASAVCSLVATIIVFLTCCAGRSKRRRQSAAKMEPYDAPATTTYRRRHFWQRR